MQELRFDGATYEPERDRDRLSRQHGAVKQALSDGGWWTLTELREHLAAFGIVASEAGVSARIRDLRKPRFGSHNIVRKRVGSGLFAYCLLPVGRAAAALAEAKS